MGSDAAEYSDSIAMMVRSPAPHGKPTGPWLKSASPGRRGNGTGGRSFGRRAELVPALADVGPLVGAATSDPFSSLMQSDAAGGEASSSVPLRSAIRTWSMNALISGVSLGQTRSARLRSGGIAEASGWRRRSGKLRACARSRAWITRTRDPCG